MDRIKMLKDKVLYVLNRYPETRNDDAILTLTIIATYLPDEVLVQDDKHYISTYALRLIREDNVKRIRAVIQNEEHKYLPTLEAVRRQRKISEEEWRNALGYNPELRTI